MRSFWRTLLLSGLCLFPVVAQDDTDTIEWFGDYDKAVQEAKRTNKPIFLEFRCEA
jgi:uncharacterized protein YyaL (SSP411 family)